LVDPAAPAFTSYPVDTSKPAKGAKLDLSSSPTARKYRTVLRDQMSRGANFAGHYRVAVWGCGSSCAMFAVINLDSGKVIVPRGANSVDGATLAANDFLPNADSDGIWGLRFTENSRLLVLVGALNEDEARQGAHYFVLTNDKLKLVHTTAVQKNCPN
jgi:hypothetical protein